MNTLKRITDKAKGLLSSWSEVRVLPGSPSKYPENTQFFELSALKTAFSKLADFCVFLRRAGGVIRREFVGSGRVGLCPICGLQSLIYCRHPWGQGGVA